MVEFLGDVLAKRNWDEPAEVQVIKDFVAERFQATAAVLVQSRQIIITVEGAGLAGTLRMHLHELQKQCKTSKRLVIRIG